MGDLIFWTAVFMVSLIVLIKSSESFTVSAEKVGFYFGVPSFITGVVLVSLGTTFPELISSIFAVLKGSSEIVIGTVIGSNITNVFLVLGVTAIVAKKMNLFYELVHVDLPIFTASAFLTGMMILDGGISRREAAILVFGLIIYMFYTISSRKKHKEKKLKLEKKMLKKKKLDWKIPADIVVCSLFIFLSAKLAVDSIINLSIILDIGKEIIAASALALGTSLPELMVGICAAKQGNPEMAVGNVLGANIFNSFGVFGIAGLFGAIIVPPEMIAIGLPILLVSIMLLSALLYFFITLDKEITQWEGWILIMFYVFFIGKLFNLF